MSDLLIRNFDPPKYGYREIRIHPNGRVTEVDECGFDEAVGMAEYIPPHGRLIDADLLCKVLQKNAEDEWNNKTAPFSWAYAYDCVKDTVENMPTIIPASGENDNE